MRYLRMPIEIEAPEELGYGNIRYNLSESSVTDRTLGGLGFEIPDLTLLYGEHRGSPRLRELICEGHPALAAEDVLITGGAAGALFIVHTAMLGPDDNLVVIRPNYATNLETPRAIGCDITTIDLVFEEGFRIEPARIAAAITPSTKLVSITTPHNPTGVMLGEADLQALVEITAKAGCHLLVDETYRDLSLTGKLPPAAALGEHVIGVSSLSKAYGVPGIRAGWVMTRDRQLQERLLAAKEQISICGSVIDEWIAEQILTDRDAILGPVLDEMRRRHATVTQWIEQEDMLEWVPPAGGVVCFPRMTGEPVGGTDAFYQRLLQDKGAYVGPGHWFEMPDTHFRLGYGWPSSSELEAGLEAISQALRAR